MRKFLAVLLAVLMVMSLMTCAFADDTAEDTPMLIATKDMDGQIVILHSNDVHGEINGYASMKAAKDYYEAQGAYVLVLDAGDFSQGDARVNISQGDTAIELMNMVGYSASALGNHEFDFGYANIAENAKDADFPILACNITYNGAAAFESNTTFTAPDGTTIGVFGVDTPETASKANPAKIQGVSFGGSGSTLAKECQTQADALKDCDYVICVGHLGIDDESSAEANRSIDMLNEVTGIDIMIDGHSHSTIEDIIAENGSNKVGDTVITSTGTKFANIGVITIKDGEISTALLPVNQDDWSVTIGDTVVPADATVLAKAAEIQASVDAEYGKVFATSEVTLNGTKAPGNRTEETNNGDLITDAMKWYVLKDGNELGVADENVVAITNGGGIRAAINPGEVTKKDINTVLPFGNTVTVVYVSGSVLLEVLEASTFCTPSAIGGFPQVAGIEYTIYADASYDKGEIYGTTTYSAPNSINRVTINSINGKDFDADATYAVITNDFCAAGGDTYYSLSVSDKITDTGIPLDEAVMAYVTDELGGVITAEKYGEPQGRIHVIDFSDVESDAWYSDSVAYVTKAAIMNGTSTTTFAPDTDTTREMLVTMLYNLAGKPDYASVGAFTDVQADQWYTDAVNWAAENKITSGYDDGTFGVGDKVTREQFVTLMYNFAKYMNYDVSVGEDTNILDYNDVQSTSDYAISAFQWACGEGIINGIDGNLVPQGSATRAMAARILTAFCTAYAK